MEPSENRPVPQSEIENASDTNLKIGARVESEIRERIKLLENRVAGYRKHAKITLRDDRELQQLREFLKSLGLPLAIVAALVVTWPGQSSARDISRACGPYMDARRCLDELRAETQRCTAAKFGGKPTDAELISCINQSLSKAGAFDTGGEQGGEQ